jgi:hypothetical protein
VFILFAAFVSARAQPVISGVTAQSRPSSAIITWNTDSPTFSQVDYGLTTNYEVGSVFDDNDVTNPVVLMTGLVPNQTYYFQIDATDDNGDDTIATGSFSTDMNLVITSLQAQYLGVWVNTSAANDRFSQIYKYASVAPNAPQASATYRPNIPASGQYDVYLWYSQGANRSQIAPVTVSFQGGFVSSVVNETANGGNWQLLTKNQSFAAGTNGFVRLSNYTGENNKIIISDAVEFAYTPGQDLPVNGNVPAWYANYYFGSNSINASQPAANGYSILTDYILGIDPTDPDTTLDFTLAPYTNGFQATFYPWEGGRIYQLQSTTNLAHPVWHTITNLPVTTDGFGDGYITSTNGPRVSTYYRLSVQLMP